MGDRGFISAGWWGYFICAVIYTITSLRAGDWLAVMGSLFFLGATVCFMVPFYRPNKDRSDDL